MKRLFWMVGGFCAAAAGFLVLGARRTQSLTATTAVPVDQLAHRLEEAWSDHHTVV
jgi:hypothetical protein